MTLADQFLDIADTPVAVREVTPQPLDLDHFRRMRTVTGHIVGDLVFREGHFLLYKIPM